MSAKGTCQVCYKTVKRGVICDWDYARLETAMDRAVDLHEDLESGHRRRHGETVGRSTTSPMPISVAVMDARTALSDALHGAVRGLLPGVPRLVVPDAVRLLQAHGKRVRESWVAPALLLELEPAVAQAARALDKPRGRMSVPGRCRECGPSMLHLAQGSLVCDRCGETHSIADIRRSVA